jgi:serine/threonine-protein kinase RIM15
MWVLKPYVPPQPLRIDLPPELVQSLGFGADVLVTYLEGLSNGNVTDLNNTPPPPTELCRICERRVPTWWFEQHCEICVLEHKAESELQIAHEALLEQRNTIASLLSAYDNRTTVGSNNGSTDTPASSSGSPPRSFSSSGSSSTSSSLSSPQTPTIEYRGFALPGPPPPVSPVLDPTLGAASPPRSPLVNSVAKRAIQRSSVSTSTSGTSKKSPVRLTELLLELSDMALQINIPEIRYNADRNNMEAEASEDNDEEDEFRVHSPQSETRIHQVMGWIPSSVDDPGMALLCSDTETYARRKVDAALRLGNIITYSEKIRREIETGVQQVIEETVEKIIQQNDEYYEGDETYADEEIDEDDEDEDVDFDDFPPPRREDGNKPIFSDAYMHGDALPVTSTAPSDLRQYATSPANVSPYQPPVSHSTTGGSGSTPFKKLNFEDADLTRPKAQLADTGGSSTQSEASLKKSNCEETDHGKPRHLFPGGLSPDSRGAGPQKNDVVAGSLTPKSILSGSPSSIPTGALNTDKSRVPPSMDSDSGGNDEHQLVDFDLNATVPRVRGRKSTSNLASSSPQGVGTSSYGSPRTGAPLRGRAHTTTGDNSSPHTPYASPLLFPHEYVGSEDRHHRRKSSANSDVSRAPVSPLLTSSVPSTKPPQPSIKDYEIISPISKGAFGSVYLSRKKLTGEYFAIKVLKKADMIAKNQVMNVKAERAILMAQSESPFVAKLFFTFQSKDYLFLVMEYLNGGDCAALIKALGGLPETWAQKYIAEVIVGVEDLHQKGIVHRDLKPDNLLIDYKGHLKLTDFGLSRMGLVGRHTRIRNADSTGSRSSSNNETPLDTPSSRTPSYDVSRPSTSTSQGTMLHDPNISLVPGYFNLNKAGGGGSSSSGFERGAVGGNRTDSSGSESLNHPRVVSRAVSEEGNDQSTMRQSPSSNVSENSSQAANTPPMVLFDPEDATRKFVGTPDYLAPETIKGVGQDETSDWWSLGCILFEFLYGYPPFNDETPEKVFENILTRNIQWDDEISVSKEAKDLINKLLCLDQNSRLGAKGAEEIKAHPFFIGINNWDTLWDEEASFIPEVDNPESTDYFDLRGAVMQEFPEEMAAEEDTASYQPSTSSAATGTTQGYQSDSSENSGTGAAARPSGGSPSMGSGSRKDPRIKHIPLHIPPHVRDGRVRRLSESSANDEFGAFSFKNLPVLERANKNLIYKLKNENQEQRSSSDASSGGGGTGRSRGLSISTNLPRRGGSPNSVNSGPSSPRHSISATSALPTLSTSVLTGPLSGPVSAVSPSRRSSTRPMAFSGAHTNPTSPSVCSHEPSAIEHSESHTAIAPIPIKRHGSSGSHNSTDGSTGSGNTIHHFRRGSSFRRLSNMESSPELREQFKRQSVSSRYNQVFDMSPCNSDTEESKNSAFLRVQKRRQASIRVPSGPSSEPKFRTLDILVCDINPVWRYSTEKMLVRLGCRVVSVNTGPEAVRRATGDIKFDLIILEYRLAKTNGSDVARLIHSTMNPNTTTPIVAMTKFVKDAKEGSAFSGIIEKPPTVEKLTEQLRALCCWKPNNIDEPPC